MGGFQNGAQIEIAAIIHRAGQIGVPQRKGDHRSFLWDCDFWLIA
jgi:hypothetical protein